MRNFLLLLLFLPTLALAKVEMFQIVVFDWDTDNQVLQLVSLGSGTAVGDDLILTNKHVVQTGVNKFADLLILCQAERRAGEKVQCEIAAGVVAVHPDEDVALVRPIDLAFFPKVRVSYLTKRVGDPVRVFGFPVPNQKKQGFGDNRTIEAFTAWAEDPSQPLQTTGDKLTVTRGQVQLRLQNTVTGFTYTKTNAKVDFGNSGGAAFDEYGDYLGIVTYKDQDGDSIFLEYHQIDEWVSEHAALKPNFEQVAYNFYKGIGTNKTNSILERLRSLQKKRVGKTNTKPTNISPSVEFSGSNKSLTTRQQRLYEYLRQKRAAKD